jgi:beta-glucosidase
MAFRDDFVWGVAASSYQIEGGTPDDGRGESIWDEFCRVPGAVFDGHSGAVACDHYRRWPDDLALISAIGARAYRLSISWPRVMPDGTGRVNPAGIDFYSRLVDGLLERDIQPWVTLFHWDLPAALQRRGGWLNRDIARWFEDYSAVVVDALSDRVSRWMTLNEPQVFIKFGHADGTNAPGLKLPLADQLLATHHCLLAHGRSVRAIRDRAKTTPAVGWAVVCVVRMPHAPADLDAARAATLGIHEPHLWNNSWYSDAVLRGRYPDDGLRVYGSAAPTPHPGDMELMSPPLDFIGLNIYEGQHVRANPDGGTPLPAPRAPGYPRTAFGWPIEPDSLYWGPRFMHERYRLPVYITENGLSNLDWVALDGGVHDPNRIDFTARYLRALRRAAADAVDVRGYFHWSLMDNFEWAAGYRERFGLIHVDYATQKRTLKDSAHWFRTVIESNGSAL